MRFEVGADAANADSADPQAHLRYLVVDRFAKAYARDLFYLRAAERILADGALPDVFALYLRGTDDVQHGFWKFMEPSLFEGVSKEDAERFGKVIERYWQWTDAAVGKVLSYYRDTPHLTVVVSDHGAGPAIGVHAIETHAHLHLSGSHRDTGVLVAAGPGVRRGATVKDASIYDITPTILHYLGEPVASDMDGRVLDDLFTGELARREVRRVATYDDARDTERKHSRSDVDDQALEHLRSLGYID
jgi:predicted AlkP superfamily phosphohydrolase/phosphomutase